MAHAARFQRGQQQVILVMAVRAELRHQGLVVNGKKIRTLDELAKALEQPGDRIVINMIGDGPPLVLDPKQVEESRERIKTRYNVVREENLQEQPATKPHSMTQL